MTADPRTIDVYNAQVDAYAKLAIEDQVDRHLTDFMALIPQGGQVLDLGCGPGRASHHMAQAGLNPDPLDASPAMVAHARDTYDLNARLGTFDDIQGTDIYHGVWANFSLLHAQRDRLDAHFQAIAAALRPGGVFHIGMKLGDGESRDDIDRRYTYVTEQELVLMIEKTGLNVTYRDFGNSPGLSGSHDPWIICRAEKPHA